jgi:hypothetical protein
LAVLAGEYAAAHDRVDRIAISEGRGYLRDAPYSAVVNDNPFNLLEAISKIVCIDKSRKKYEHICTSFSGH